MFCTINKRFVLVLPVIFFFINVQAQQKVLGIKEAEQIALSNYGAINQVVKTASDEIRDGSVVSY